MNEGARAELRQLLDTVPGGAERLLRAIDEGRLFPYCWVAENDCGTVGCVYGHVYGEADLAEAAARSARASPDRLSPLEFELVANWTGETIRPEVVAWLAEHGTAHELVPREVVP